MNKNTSKNIMLGVLVLSLSTFTALKLKSFYKEQIVKTDNSLAQPECSFTEEQMSNKLNSAKNSNQAFNSPWNEVPLGVAVHADDLLTWDTSKAAHLLAANGTGNSNVTIGNVLRHLNNHKNIWKLYGIDTKGVNLKGYEGAENFIKNATSKEEITELLTNLSEEMKQRFNIMKKESVDKYSKTKEEMKPIMLVIDSYSSLHSLLNNDDHEILNIVTRIAEIGRPTGIHLLIGYDLTLDDEKPKMKKLLKSNLLMVVAMGSISDNVFNYLFHDNINLTKNNDFNYAYSRSLGVAYRYYTNDIIAFTSYSKRHNPFKK